MLMDIQNYTSRQEEGGLTIYLRSINYNPLGGKHAACPPVDFRSPMVIDGYNAILKRLAAEFHVPFIDTNFIVGPMWDQAIDWNHYHGEVGNQIAKYIIARVLNLVA
jgi:hypothetical protein